MPSENLHWTIDTTKLDKIIRDSGANADKIIRTLAFKGAGYAKELAPVDTHALQNSIYVVTQKSDGYNKAAGDAKQANPGVNTAPIPTPDKGEASFGPCVDYGAYQEFGTSKMSAHPYMTPAVEQLKKEMADGTTYREMVGAAIESGSLQVDEDWAI